MNEKSKTIDKAQKLLQKGYLDKAIAEYKKVVEKDPKDATIRLRIGDLYVKVNKKDEAIKEYEEILKEFPDDFEAKENLEFVSGGAKPQFCPPPPRCLRWRKRFGLFVLSCKKRIGSFVWGKKIFSQRS